MRQEAIYLDIEPELLDRLSEIDVSLEQAIHAELKARGVDATVKWDRNPTVVEPDRELFLVILAGAAAVALVGSAVERVLDAVNRGRPTVVVRRELTAAVDGAGAAIFDRHGNPVYNVVEAPSVAEKGQGTGTTELTVGTLFRFRTATGAPAGNPVAPAPAAAGEERPVEWDQPGESSGAAGNGSPYPHTEQGRSG